MRLLNSFRNFFTTVTKETPDMFAKIVENNGRFIITDRSGLPVIDADYGRARDAKRGALRRGFAVA